MLKVALVFTAKGNQMCEGTGVIKARTYVPTLDLRKWRVAVPNVASIRTVTLSVVWPCPYVLNKTFSEVVVVVVIVVVVVVAVVVAAAAAVVVVVEVLVVVE
ncbi:hypothetical protein ElyMa_001428100 [Elysia marginata]|uniref:Uncharacterized protein n=1 Tax=Elysia marginata TaxID=1093978 RepID=A0AAV4IY51_9GAST|nr:hypothetical protein ElyMa_001428100 [Elysia marginata]